MTELRVPKLNNNDTEYLLVEWLAGDGAEVLKGEPLVIVETSKAAEELVAEADGVLSRMVEAGETCAPGDVVARILDGSALPPSPAHAAAPGTDVHEPRPGTDSSDPIVTAPAQALIDEHGVALERIRALGMKVVRRADVAALLAADDDEPPPPQALPTVQRAVAAAVTRSHREIPAAFTAVKLDVGPAMERARRLTKQVRALIGLTELLVAAVAGLHEWFPMFFAEPVDGDPDAPGGMLAVRPAASPNVGVTMDVGRGLYVPVLHDADRLSLKEIAQRLTDFRTTALRGSFREEDLAGGNIVITLHTDAAVILAVPIVFPGHACALSLSAPQHELILDKAGNIAKRTIVTLGLAFDHRIINGRDAAQFLTAIQNAIVAPSQ